MDMGVGPTSVSDAHARVEANSEPPESPSTTAATNPQRRFIAASIAVTASSAQITGAGLDGRGMPWRPTSLCSAARIGSGCVRGFSPAWSTTADAPAQQDLEDPTAPLSPKNGGMCIASMLGLRETIRHATSLSTSTCLVAPAALSLLLSACWQPSEMLPESSGSEASSGSVSVSTAAEDDEGSVNSEVPSIGPEDGGPRPFEVNGRLEVIDGQLSNQYGNAIQLRGMSSHGLQWYRQCVTDKAMDVLAYGWGVDLLRTSVYVQEDGYETKPEYFRDLVDTLVQGCEDRGIYCLVDWHQLNPGDPNFNLELAKEFFEHVSKTHADRGNVIYEICNEPSGVEWSAIKSYAEQIIPIIRANDPDSVIVVGTPRWASRPHDVIGNELEFDNILYTMHFYAKDHREEFRRYVEQAEEAGIGIFVTEFGTQEASGDGPNDFDSAQAWLDLLEEHQISWSNWNFSDDERSGAVWEQGTCRRSAFSDGNLKPAGKWIKERISDPPDDFPVNRE